MIEKSFNDVFDRFKFQFFRRIFDQVRERDGSLTAMEAFSLEIIDLLHAPTIGQFADFLNISQSNATYKVNSLMRKYHLILSEKFYRYMSLLTSYEDTVMARMKERFSTEELEAFEKILRVMADELMPECDAISADRAGQQ